MELLHKSLSLSSITNLLSRRRMLMGAGVVAATAGGAPHASAQGAPSNLKSSIQMGSPSPPGVRMSLK